MNSVKKKPDFFNKLPYFLVIIPLLYVVALIIGGFITRPFPEDYGIASISIRAGVLNAAIHRFYTFDGRYATNFMHGLTPLVWGSVKYYFLAPLFFIFSFIGGWIYFLRSVYTTLSRVKSFLYAIIFAAVFYGATTHLCVWMYEAAGSFVYGFSGSIFLFLSGTFIRLTKAPNPKRHLLLLIQAILLVAFVIGLNELVMVFVNMFLGAFLFFQIVFRKYRNLIIDVIILLLVCLSCTVFVLTTPGIGQDVNMDFNSTFTLSNILSSIYKSASYSLVYLSGWIFITPITFFIFYLVEVCIYRRISMKMLLLTPLIAIPLTYLVLIISNLTYIIPFNEIVTFDNFPYRTFSTGLLQYMVIHILTLRMVSQLQMKSKLFNHEIHVMKIRYLVVAIVAFVILFFSFDNVRMMMNDWYTGKITKYRYDMAERFHAIETAKKNHQKTVTLKVINSHPTSIIDLVDINCTEDGTAWLKAYRNYFGITVKVDCESDTTRSN